MWPGSDYVRFMQLNLKLHWVVRVAKNFVRGSEGTIYSGYLECISVTFPIPTGFGHHVGRVGSLVKPSLDPTVIYYCLVRSTRIESGVSFAMGNSTAPTEQHIEYFGFA